MGHLVQYRTAAGESASEAVAALEDALELAARLRNDDRAEDVRVYAEIPLRFETYVRVSVVDADVPSAQEGAESGATPSDAAPTDTDTTPVEPPPGAMPLAPITVGNGGGGSRMFQGS